MLERRKVEHIVVARPVRDKGIEDIAPCIDGKGGKFTLDIPKRRANIAHELDHVVL